MAEADERRRNEATRTLSIYCTMRGVVRYSRSAGVPRTLWNTPLSSSDVEVTVLLSSTGSHTSSAPLRGDKAVAGAWLEVGDPAMGEDPNVGSLPAP